MTEGPGDVDVDLVDLTDVDLEDLDALDPRVLSPTLRRVLHAVDHRAEPTIGMTPDPGRERPDP